MEKSLTNRTQSADDDGSMVQLLSEGPTMSDSKPLGLVASFLTCSYFEFIIFKRFLSRFRG